MDVSIHGEFDLAVDDEGADLSVFAGLLLNAKAESNKVD